MKQKVSIIVPIYNVEKYIEKCVKSLLTQKHSNVEIILVDDGSPDNSGRIIDELACIDSRIIVIHQKNAGVSSARNVGIDMAHGEYIMFVDGDDWVDPDYVSYFLELVNDNNCEIGMNKYNYHLKCSKSYDDTYIVSSEQAMEWIYIGDLFVAVWNKIYKKSFLKDNHILFNSEIWYGEGMLFNIECLQYVELVAIGEKSVYHQTFNPSSAMRSFNLESNFCGIKSLQIQKSIWKKQGKKLDDAWNYHRYYFNRSIVDGLIRSNQISANKEVFNECVKNIRQDIFIPLKIEKRLIKIIGWLGYFVCPVIMGKRARKKFLTSKNNLNNI